MRVLLPWSTWPAVAMTCVLSGHLPATPTQYARRPASARRRTPVCSAGRAGTRRRAPAATPRGHRRAAGRAAASGRRTAHPGSGTPGAPPPPTRPSCATTDASTASARRSARARSRSASACSAWVTGEAPARTRRLERGEGEFVGAHRARQRMPCHPRDHVGATEHDARLRAAEQLVTAGGDDVGAFGQRGGGVGLVGQQRVRREQPAAEVCDQGQVVCCG